MNNETKAPSVDASLLELRDSVQLMADAVSRLHAKLDSIRLVINGPKHSADKVAKVSEILSDE